MTGKFSLMQTFAQMHPGSSEEIFTVFIFAEWMHDALTTPLPIDGYASLANQTNIEWCSEEARLCNNGLVFLYVETFAIIVLTRTYAPPFRRLGFSYKCVCGGAYNWLVSFIRPFSCCGAREGNNNDRIVCHRLVRLAIKLIVAQLCRTKDHEIINEATVCSQKRDAVFVPPPASYEPAVA